MKTLQQAYFAKRAENPELSACQAVKFARAEMRQASHNLPRWVGDSVSIDLPRGEYITLAIESDYDADASERLQFETESARYDDLTEYAPSGWIARDGRVLHNGFDHRVEWQWWEDNYSFAQFWKDGKRNNSRHNAWLRARRLVGESFDYARRAIDAGYVGYVVTLHDANGEELGHESCWGFENIGDYCAQEGHDAAAYMAKKRAEHWQREADKARETMRAVRQQFIQAASEYRAMRLHQDAALFPLSCDAIRANMNKLLRQFADALRVVTAY